MKQAIAPALSRMIQDIPPVHRGSVMRALTTQPRVQQRWIGNGGSGCFWAIATFRVTGMSRNQFMKDPVGHSSRTFGVDTHRVAEVYQEWDQLTPTKLQEFIDSVQAEIVGQVDALGGEAVSPVRRFVAGARQLVGV